MTAKNRPATVTRPARQSRTSTATPRTPQPLARRNARERGSEAPGAALASPPPHPSPGHGDQMRGHRTHALDAQITAQRGEWPERSDRRRAQRSCTGRPDHVSRRDHALDAALGSRVPAHPPGAAIALSTRDIPQGVVIRCEDVATPRAPRSGARRGNCVSSAPQDASGTAVRRGRRNHALGCRTQCRAKRRV
jgi:hypothetical protein